MLLKKLTTLMIIVLLCTACNTKEVEDTDTKPIDTQTENEKTYAELLSVDEALEIFQEETIATVLDIETGITFEVKRITGGFTTLADVETLTQEETDKLLSASGGDWNIMRRAVIVTIGDTKIAGSLAPFQHSGDENYDYGEIIDNRSGATGTGINLDSIKDNGMIGVVDIYFYNSLIPGINKIDERHQEMVLKAYEYKE